MSLKNRPEFEAEVETEVEVETTTTTEKEITMNTQSTSVAAANNTAVGAPAKFAVAFKEMNGFFDMATVESLALATPRIKGEQGSLYRDQDDLGKEVSLEIVSFNPRWVIGTGENTSDAESKGAFRVSYDGETTTDGENVHDYIEALKAQGYTKAKKSPYLDIFGFIVAKGGKEIPEESRELVCLQCSKTSMGAFQAFATTQGLLQSRGLATENSVIKVRAEARSMGTNKYTNFSFHRA